MNMKIPLQALQSTQQLDVSGLEQEPVFSSWGMCGFLFF